MWRAVFDFVQGTSHVGSGVPCQDACRVMTWPSSSGDVLIAAAADGAGSASHSHIGSLLACDTVIDCATRSLNEYGHTCPISREQVTDWYKSALMRVTEEALTLGVPPRELACTLLVAVVAPTNATYAQIGDGAIVVSKAGEFSAVFWPQRGEYANTTNFLTSEPLEALIDFHVDEEIPSDVAVFSDGLERLILRFADKSVHRPFLDPLFSQLRASEDVESLFLRMRRFLDSPGINQRTDDDKTLILASRY